MIDQNFITGLVIGQNHSTRNYQAAQEWRGYAEGLEKSLNDLNVNNILNHSDMTAIMKSLASLDQATKAKVAQAFSNHYVPAYVQNALYSVEGTPLAQQGFSQDYATKRATNALQKQLAMIGN